MSYNSGNIVLSVFQDMQNIISIHEIIMLYITVLTGVCFMLSGIMMVSCIYL